MNQQDKIYAYFDRDPELRVLFIFDNDFLNEELKAMEWASGCRYVEFKGDWFTMKYMLDTEWENDKVIMYFHQESPMKSKALQEKFPLMDVLAANMEYHEQDYVAFMQQYGLPQSMATFVEQNIQQLQTAKMMKLLAPCYYDKSINVDIAARAFLCSYMGLTNVQDWDHIIIQLLLQGRASEQKKQLDFYVRLRSNNFLGNYLSEKLNNIFGVSYEDNTEEKIEKLVQVFKYNAIVQNLASVSADNYQQKRIKDTVALQQMNRILELAMSAPKTATALLEVFAELGTDIHDEDIIGWYGTEANYYFIPDELCIPILRTLMEKDLSTEPQKVIDRLEELMVKHGDNNDLATVMDYGILVARYYERVLAMGSYVLDTPDSYVQKYQSDYYLIDQLYRLATGAFYNVSPTSVLFETIQNVKHLHDLNYAKLVNRINLEWMRSVEEAGGMQAVGGLRQQDFYEKQIKPMQKKVAVIVCDALRYEVAEDLVAEMGKSRHVANLDWALAMLPTETKFCKPSLLPHKTLALYGANGDANMSVDNMILDSTAKRSSHLQSYRDGAICVPYEEVADFNQDKNREIFKHSLVYIFHDDIDHIGHDGTGKQVVNGCAQAVKDIATLITKIHSTYNVTEVYVTSDHGFLFNDIEFEEKDKQKVDEDFIEKKSRYYLTKSGLKVRDIVKFPLSEVSGMKNVDDIFVAVPEGTNRLAAASGGYMFAHGGATLQEMIIPVVVSRQEREDNKQPVGVLLLDRKLSITASRLKFKLLQTEAVSMNMKERVISVALYHNDKPVTPVKEIVLDKTEQLLDARKIPVDLTLNCNVDAKVLQLKVYDVNDMMNPLIKENVTNNTLIENDFDF